MRPWGLRTSKEWFDDQIVRVQTPDGGSFKLASVRQNYLSFELFWRGAAYYEPITTQVARELVRSSGTFLDVGANIGFYSLVLSTFQPELRVIAFEPNPKNLTLLRQNLRANSLSRVVCEPLALSDVETTGSLYLSASDMSASLQRDFDHHCVGSVPVKVTTLDAYLADRKLAAPVLLKVDVEGCETAFFRGAQRTLAVLQPDIITEVTLKYPLESVALLKAAGYRFYPITDQGFCEAEALEPVVRNPFVFLNCLLSARPQTEIAGLFARIQPAVSRMDLRQSSKYLDPQSVERFKSRFQQTQGPAPSTPVLARNACATVLNRSATLG